jgi:hypothetical protein
MLGLRSVGMDLGAGLKIDKKRNERPTTTSMEPGRAV